MPYAPEHDEIPNPLRYGLRADSMPEPCAVVVFGASGDLAHRKLIPALYDLALQRLLPPELLFPGLHILHMARQPVVQFHLQLRFE